MRSTVCWVRAKWLIVPAMIGGAASSVDGLTSVATTAIEGLRTIPAAHAIIGDNQHIVVMITIAILCTPLLCRR